ncbi:conserved hypothetical protein [Pseudomonas protegens Pf-5]|uniref:Uncharacterized protein n=1 Tax=Pseudomonas fluorescens (strain ATCC BAA-477 / NRRL B-23932 / Pf-5) TaxID=220664 RepID=Q4KBV9_PSEF5|nr:conserved hypothetical protein [Pseudomonas protegens Pf-5]
MRRSWRRLRRQASSYEKELGLRRLEQVLRQGLFSVLKIRCRPCATRLAGGCAMGAKTPAAAPAAMFVGPLLRQQQSLRNAAGRAAVGEVPVSRAAAQAP